MFCWEKVNLTRSIHRIRYWHTFGIHIGIILAFILAIILRSRYNPYRNGRSSSFSVSLPRSAYAIVSIVSVFITKILASHISHQQLSKFQQLDQRQEKKEPAMAYEGIQSTLQVRQACLEVLRNNCNIDRSRILDSCYHSSPSNKIPGCG